MKIFLAANVLALSSVLVSAQLVVPLAETGPMDQENLDQIPIELGFGWHGMEQQPNGPPLLSDILGIDRSISIFAGLGRSVESIATRLADEKLNSTLLVPRNSALQNLHRKPWEDKEEDGKVTQDDGSLWSKEAEDKARQNVEEFVAGHVIPTYPIQPCVELETIRGTKVSYTISKSGEKIVNPGNIKVLGEREAANGAIWVLDGVIE